MYAAQIKASLTQWMWINSPCCQFRNIQVLQSDTGLAFSHFIFNSGWMEEWLKLNELVICEKSWFVDCERRCEIEVDTADKLPCRPTSRDNNLKAAAGGAYFRPRRRCWRRCSRRWPWGQMLPYTCSSINAFLPTITQQWLCEYSISRIVLLIGTVN